MRSQTGLSPHRLYNPQKKDDTIVYAIVLQWPTDNKVKLGATKPTDTTKVSMLGYNGTITFKPLKPTGIVVDFGSVQWKALPNTVAWTLKLENLESDGRVPYMEDSKVPPGSRSVLHRSSGYA